MEQWAISGEQQGVSKELHPLVIPKFDGRYKFLNNDYLSPIIMDGQEHLCATAAYLAARCVDPAGRKEFANLPWAAAQALASAVQIKVPEDETKAESMYGILRLKFSQSPSLRTWLLETDNAILVNSNDYHDNYWGACVCRDCLNNPGQNVLGVLLMHLRRKLRHVADAHCP